MQWWGNTHLPYFIAAQRMFDIQRPYKVFTLKCGGLHFQGVKLGDAKNLLSRQMFLAGIPIFFLFELLLYRHPANVHNLVFFWQMNNFEGLCLVDDVDFE